MSVLPDIQQILEQSGIYLKKSIYVDLGLYGKSRNKHTHIAFLLGKNNNVITYKSNIYFKTKKFPFSQHAEINVIINYYSKQNLKRTMQNNKKLVVIKLGPNCMRMSKPCQQCASFISNNWENLKLKEVLYSNSEGSLDSLSKEDLLLSSNFCKSSAYRVN